MRFTSHVTGSLPCMPARHDILCGALDFLWRPWGSIEIWEEPITAQLRRAGVTTMLVSDHPHLFETGGENYHTDFTAWDYVRGHEGDPWRTYRGPELVGAPALPARGGAWYWKRLGMTDAHDGPTTPRALVPRRGGLPRAAHDAAAADWLAAARRATSASSCSSTSSTPTSPSTRPSPGAGRYDPDWEDDLIIWPPYDVGAVAGGRLERARRPADPGQLRRQAVDDRPLGRAGLRRADRTRPVGDTVVVVCTDHGHYLGEKDIWGKPGVMQYEPLGHMPLLMHWPGVAGGRPATR